MDPDDPRAYNHGHGTPNAVTERWQTVLNQSWPFVDAKGKRHANGVPRRTPIAVTARIVFERDGEVWLDGTSDRWHGQSVCVDITDPRLQVRYVWVDASDVKRR